MIATTQQTYEHFRPIKSAGFGKLGTAGTILLFVAAIGFITVRQFFGWIPAMVWGMFSGLLLLSVAVKDKRTGMSVMERLNTLIMFHVNDRRGVTTYHSGPFSKLGECTLPGLLAQSRLYEGTDSFGNTFGIVHMPSVDHWVVTIECHPDSESLMDEEDRIDSIDNWGEWLSFMPSESDAVQVMVTVETSPSSGPGLRKEIIGNVKDDAPELARRVLSEIADSYPKDSATVRTWVTVTFSSTKDAQGVVDALAPRLPVILAKLQGTGAGACRLVDGQGLCEMTRVAYDPAAGQAIADAEALGVPRVWMRWNSVGPLSSVATWDDYQHDSGISMTWTMTRILGRVKAGSLVPLLQPHPKIAHKRVSLIFELRDFGDSAGIAQSGLNAAEFKMTRSRKPTAHDAANLVSAKVTADEEEGGHALLDCSVGVTATVRSLEDKVGAEAAMKSISAASRLWLRAEDGVQDSAFVGNLAGLGLVMSAHSVVPSLLRDKL